MTILYIDFETRSPVDLKTAGLHNYATDPRTEVLCLGWAYNDMPVELWAPGRAIPSRVFTDIRDGVTVVAHNFPFEYAVWNNIMVPRYGWPPLRLEQAQDTMAMAYAMSLPGSLENAAAAVGLEANKDKAGHRLMLAMCKPREDGTYRESPEDLAKLYEYCKQDVEVERQLYKRLRPLSKAEHAIWVLDQQINNRGIYVDLPSIKAAIQIVEKEQKRLDGKMRRVTGNAVAGCTAVQQLLDWIRSQGVEIPGVAKADVLDALSGQLPELVRTALHLRKEAGKSSTAKLKAMVESSSADSRIRGTMQYHGAGTGRWAGRRINPQNYPRGSLKPTEVEDALGLLRQGKRDEVELVYGPVLDAISSCLRGMITAAPGHELVCCDFSAIEARVLAWLAGQEDVLEIFRGHGKIYEHAASKIYGKPMEEITKDERQIGKVSTLALGFQGSIGAFQTMARAYNVAVSDERADEIKTAWRKAHPKIQKYWCDLEEAAIGAVRYPGDVFEAGHQPVRFRVKGSFLWCQLPSGRLLCYPYPKLVTNKFDRDAVQCMSVNSLSKKWEPKDMYAGLYAENVCQAVSRDLLANAIANLEGRGMKVVFHCHDEAVVEAPCGAFTVADVEHAMISLPSWAEGLPLTAEGWAASRYKK